MGVTSQYKINRIQNICASVLVWKHMLLPRAVANLVRNMERSNYLGSRNEPHQAGEGAPKDADDQTKEATTYAVAVAVVDQARHVC